MQSLRSVAVVAAALLPSSCRAHWRLTKPVPRSGGVYENNPLPPEANTQEEWVCRRAQPNPAVPRPTVAAGSTTSIVYGTGAIGDIGHAGDCAVYVSYDLDRPRRAMRWVKIANLPDCRSQINQNVPITIPAELPAGIAVLRWDQYALHQGTFIEWFLQCADVILTSSSARSWESFNTFSIIDNDGTPAYPSSVTSYRSPYTQGQKAPGEPAFWMTGPACVDDSLNQCALTAVGTKGYTGFGGGDRSAGSPAPASPAPTPAPSPGATPAPAPPMPYPTAPGPSPPPPLAGDAMCCYDAGCGAYGTSLCNGADTWCSGSEEACQSCGGSLCAEPAGAAPAPPSPPAPPPPEAAGSAQCCYAGGCASYGTPLCNAAGSWCSGSVGACSGCGGTLCSGASLVSTGGRAGRSKKFLHRPRGLGEHAPVQLGVDAWASAEAHAARV